MTITVSNQKPTLLDEVHLITCSGDFDPMKAIRHNLIDPLLQPLSPTAAVSITDGNGADITGDLEAMIMGCLGETVNPAAERQTKDLLAQTLVHFNAATTLPVGELFAAQAGHQLGLPDPSANVLYYASNAVIPAAKELLAGIGEPAQFFAALAYAYHPATLGFWFQSSAAFEDFKTWLTGQMQTMVAANVVPASTAKLMNDFTALSLRGLTESLTLRKNDSDGNEEFSFPRLLIHMLMSYAQQQRHLVQQGQQPEVTSGALPFLVGELFVPRSVVLVNAEAHARASAGKITSEWSVINQSLSSPVRVVSNTALSKLTSLPRAAARAAVQSAGQYPGKPGSRSAQVVFRKQPPTKLDLYNNISRVLKRMGKVNKSHNVFRHSKTTFLKANRRDPDDFNKVGRITTTQYMPDLHIYIDTSGSISEENYQEAVMMLIRIAKRLNVNLYFNSFSHLLSQEVMLRTENKSTRQIWKEFRRVPKVTGGTEFSQVWRHINASRIRQRRLSLMVTDFCWSPPSTREDHPPNLYYAPCSAMDWDMMVGFATDYADRMTHIEPSIRQRLLGMIV